MVTADSANPHTAARAGGDEPEHMVWITVAAALVIGLFLMFFITNQTSTAPAGNTTISYPSTWVASPEKGALFAVADLKGGGTFGDRVSVTQLARTDLLPGKGGIQEAAANWSLQQQDARVAYRSLSIKSIRVQDKDAAQIENAYLMDSPYGVGGLPALMHGYDTVVQSADGFYVLSFATSNPDNDHARSANDKIVSSWRVP